MAKRPKSLLDDVQVLHRGRGYAVISKPSGVAVGHDRAALGKRPFLDGVAELLGVPRLRLVHRIDKETSGCLIVASERDAHRTLSIAFQQRAVDKSYLALVRGGLEPGEGAIDAALEVDPKGGSRMRIAVRKQKGESPRKRLASLTHYRTLVRFRGYALVLAKPVTGRQHQIRLHLRHQGAPLAIDPLYGSDQGILLSSLKRGYRPSRDGRPESPLVDRLTLHAWKLSFTDPDGLAVRVRAPLPKDLRRAFGALVRHAH